MADVHLGTLARFLRLLGFDTRYGNDVSDAELAELTSRERRILLTRDVGLLKRKAVVRGQWLRSRDPERWQIAAVRWSRNLLSERALEFGCEILSDAAEAVAVRLEGAAPHTAWLPALLPAEQLLAATRAALAEATPVAPSDGVVRPRSAPRV